MTLKTICATIRTLGPIDRISASPGTASPIRRRPLFYPVLSGLMESRLTTWILIFVATIQWGFETWGLPGWPCPIRSLLGIPCPGCGLTTALTLFITGEWLAALSVHAFSPLLLLLIVAMIMVAVLPLPLYRKTVNWISLFERKTGVTAVLLSGVLGYWLLRLWRLWSS